MTIAVRYHSRSGNTEKLALAIADEVGVKAENVSVPLTEKADVLFLGSALYAGGVDKAVKKFIAENKDNIGVIYNFGTSASSSSTYKAVKKLAEANGVALAEKAYDCRGKFLFMHKGRPNDEDCKNAAAFARDVLVSATEENTI